MKIISKQKKILIIICVIVAAALVAFILIRAGSSYQVKLIDQDGEAVPGGKVQFRTADSNATVDVGEDGTASVRADGKTYGVHVLAVPDGYLNDPSKSYQVGPGQKELDITVKGIDSDSLTFQTTDIDGNAVSSEDFSDAKVILINFWEPWCAPCISEMPDLSKLYEKYKVKGLVVLGVYSDTGDDAKSIVSDNNISYPILHSCPELSKYTSMYVPTSVFAGGDGKILSKDQIIGAKSYDEWEQMVLQYLEE